MKNTTTKFIFTALAYIVPTMFLGYVWHLIIFEDLYNSLGIYNRTEPNIQLGFFSMILQGLIVAYLYPFYAKGNSTMTKAIVFSLTLGLFLFSVSTLANAAKIEVTSMQKWLFIQTVFHLLQFIVAGLFIGLVNRQIKEPQALTRA
ncbi:MAG: hypothetical protein R2814_04750 [Flavobacteriaceae bacterium]